MSIIIIIIICLYIYIYLYVYIYIYNFLFQTVRRARAVNAQRANVGLAG